MSTSRDVTSIEDSGFARRRSDSDPDVVTTTGDPTVTSGTEESMKFIRCSVSSLLAFHRATYSYQKAEDQNVTETEYFFFINSCRCKDKRGLFTDVSAFDQNDGILVNQSYPKIQQGMVDFFTDEIKTYLVGNNDPIACTTNHYLLSKKIRERLELFKKLKRAVDELAIEIPNHGEMYTFVVLKKDINHFDKTLTDKFSLLKCLDDALVNFRGQENVNQCMYFLRTVATDASIILENCVLPESWTKTQFFQILCEEVMCKAMKIIDVDKIFLVKSNEGAINVLNALKLCLYWKVVNEYIMDIYHKYFGVELYEGNMFGSILAFNRRCKDLYEICQANGQLYSAFSTQDESSLDKDHIQINRINLEYSKLLSNISQVRHKCLDIKDDELGQYFVSFRRDMHNIDSMILDALKASFEGVTNIKEQCEILDNFHSMSERARVRDTYYLRADAVSKQLYNELSRLIHEAKLRLNYTKLFYPSLIVNFIRANALIQRGNAVIDDVTTSNVFLGDVQKLKAINRIRAPLQKSLENMLVEYKKNTHFLDGMEIDFKNFLITRSAGFEGSLDINVNREYPIVPFITRMLECLGLNIIHTRVSQFARQDVHRSNITLVCRLITEYNAFFACRLSLHEKGVFRGKVLELERRIWNGIYKNTWGDQLKVATWCKMCEETIWKLTREIIEYKKINSTIQGYLRDIKNLTFVRIDDMTAEFEPDKFCKAQFQQINNQAELVRSRCSSILSQVKKVRTLVDINEAVEENLQWSNYKLAIANKIADAVVDGLAKSLKKMATLLYQPQNRPIIKIYVSLRNKVVTVDNLGKDVCLFLDSFREVAGSAVTRGIFEKNWAGLVAKRIENESELVVLEKILQNEVEKSYINVQKFLLTLNPLKDFWTLKPDSVLEFYKEDCTDVDSFLKDLTKLKHVSEVAGSISKKRWVNFFVIDASAFLKDVLNLSKKWEKQFLGILCTLVEINTDECQSLLSDLAALIQKGEIQGKEDYMDEVLEKINSNIKDTKKVLSILAKNGIDINLAQKTTDEIEAEYLAIKRDKNQILLQQRDSSHKSSEQMKQLKIINKSLDDLIVSYKVQAPYTSSWKSEEALTEISNFDGKVSHIKNVVEEYDIKDNIENFDTVIQELETNLVNLRDIWEIVTDWEKFEKAIHVNIIKDLNVSEVIGDLEHLKNQVASFCKRSYDARIEINQTLQRKLSVFEANFSLVEDFRSQAIKVRHWMLVSKACGFDAIKDDEVVINNLSMEEFINLGLEKQSQEIKTIISKATDEFTVEEHLTNTKISLKELEFKYKQSPSGIRVITNDEILIDLIHGIIKSISNFKESEASEPFRADIDSLELRLIETNKKIDLIKRVECIFGIFSEVSTSYSLDLQLGKFQQKLAILTEIWKNIHQDISDHLGLVEAMNDEDLEGNLWSFEMEMMALQKKLMTFLNTRKFAFPKFSLCANEKIKAIFCYRSADNFNRWVSLLFPHIDCLQFKKEAGNSIIGYTTKAGFIRTFYYPLSYEWTADYIACKLQEGFRASFRDEIAQNLITTTTKKMALGKQETKYVPISMHATFITRHLHFCSEFQKYIVEAQSQQKHYVLEILAQQNNRVTNVIALLQDSKNNEINHKWTDSLGIEVAVKQVIERFVEVFFNKDIEEEEKVQEIKLRWTSMLKHCILAKDPLDLQVSVLDKTLMFGFDETADCSSVFLLAFREDPLAFIGKLLIHNFGSVMDGNAFNGRYNTMQSFASILGRHLVSIAYFDYSEIIHLEDVLLCSEATQDFVCFHNIETETTYNNLFTIILSYHMKVKEFRSMILNKISLSNHSPEPFSSRIFFLTNFPQNDLLYVGKEFRIVSISRVNIIQMAQFALLAEHFSASVKLIQLVVIGLTIVKHQMKHQIHINVKDLRNILRKAKFKITTQNAADDEAIIGALLEAYSINRKLLVSLFKHSVNTTGIDRLIDTRLLEAQVKYCQDNHINLSSHFKKMLHDVTYSLLGGNHILLYGGPVSLKTTLWKAATSILDAETIIVSNLALEPSSDGVCAMKHIPLMEKKQISPNAVQPTEAAQDLLLVIQGDLDPSIESSLLAMLQYNTFVLTDNGQLAVKDKNIRIILEASLDIHSISPSIAAFFHFHKCENLDVRWQDALTTKVFDLSKQSAYLGQFFTEMNTALLEYVDFFLNIRESMGLANDKVTQDSQFNSLIGFLNSIVGQDTSLEVSDVLQLMIYACIFCFSQDVSLESRHIMEIKIREMYECRTIPTDLSIFDFYYNPSSKSWRPLKTHPLAIKSASMSQSQGTVLLKNHLKQEIISRIMVKNLVSVDIQAGSGVGKSTMLRNLLETFNTMDFLGVAIPSCRGATLSKITNSILNCIQQGKSENEGRSAKELGGVRRNVLFCIDDVDASDEKLSQFIKFFTEHSTWLSKRGVVKYRNQVLATTRLKESSNKTPFKSVRINIDPIDTQELTNIFKSSLKEKFIEFELDIQFLITKVIMASVDINRLFLKENVDRVYFHVQDNMKIKAGLMRAHKDCHDTKYELLELWVNEVYRAYFEKIPMQERPEIREKVSNVMMHYFGEDAKELLEESHETMIGDFLDPYNFYTVIEWDELKDFVVDKVKAINAKLDWKLEVIPNKSTLMQVCQMLRALTMDQGHVLMYGTSLISPVSLMELVCKIKGIRYFKLLDTDITADKWKKKFRTITKVCGIDKIKAVLYVPMDLFDRIVEVRACLESFIDLGYDLSLFQLDELEIMTQKQGYFLELAKHTRKNFHCVVVGKTFQDVEGHFRNENFYVSNTGKYEDCLIEYPNELIIDKNGISSKVFMRVHEKVLEFFSPLQMAEDTKPNLSSYVCFMKIFNKYIRQTINDYEAVIGRINNIMSHIEKHFEFSSEQMLTLEKNKEKSKCIVTDHQTMTMKHIQSKKELKEIESHLSDVMNEYGDEQAAMLRLNMAIVEERTCQWSLFQRTIRDFDDAVLDESNMKDFEGAQENFEDVSDYLNHWRESFEFGEDDFCVKFKFLISSILQEYDVKALWQVGENERLQSLKDKIYHEVRDGSIILHAIIRIHTRMINMSKSTKNVTSKEQKLQMLQKKCKSIEDKLKNFRQQIKALERRLQDEQIKIEELQANIQAQNETINTLEQSTTEHKNLKQPLQALLDLLDKMKTRMSTEKEGLPGSIILAAAACGYCGTLHGKERSQLIKSWKVILREENIQYKDDFLPYIMSSFLRSHVAIGEPYQTKQNLAMMGALPDPILIVDPLQISLEYLELLHAENKITLLHIGDPTFKTQFITESRDSEVIIINHSTLDLNTFASHIDLQKVKSFNKKLIVYHVTPDLKESELVYVQPSQILSFDLNKEDVVKYIHNRLQLLVPDKARAADGDGDGNTIATEKDRLDVQLLTYTENKDQILDFNVVTHSVENIKKILDRSEKGEEKKITTAAAAMWAMRSTGPLDLLQNYSEVLTSAFVAIKYCPFQQTVPISLQACLTMSQKVLESLESIDKKDLSLDKIAATVTEGVMKIYDTNLCKYDCLAIKTCLLFYMYLCIEQSKSNTIVMMLEQLLDNLDNVTVFGKNLMSLSHSAHSTLTKAMVSMMACLASDFDHFQANAERIVAPIIPQKINNERDLYRVHAKSQKDMPIVINVDIDITFLEALSKFKVNFALDDFVILNVTKQNCSPFRLLEEVVERATWLVCTGIDQNRKSGNLLDFLIRWLKTAKNIDDDFRFWIICEGADTLTLTTVQRCYSHFLGHEAAPSLDDQDEEEEDKTKDEDFAHVPISAFAEAKDRLNHLSKDGSSAKKKFKSDVKKELLQSLKSIACAL